MNTDQINHREQIIMDWSNSYRPIYDKGAKEHQTVMSTLPVMMMVKEGMNESMDNYAYNHVAKSQLERVRTKLIQLKEKFQAEVDDAIHGNESLEHLENIYDPIRRIEAIERILFG